MIPRACWVLRAPQILRASQRLWISQPLRPEAFCAAAPTGRGAEGLRSRSSKSEPEDYVLWFSHKPRPLRPFKDKPKGCQNSGSRSSKSAEASRASGSLKGHQVGARHIPGAWEPTERGSGPQDRVAQYSQWEDEEVKAETAGRVVVSHSAYISGLLSALHKLSKVPGIKTVVPGRLAVCAGDKIRDQKKRLAFKVTVPTRTGYKVIGRRGTQVQEVFVVGCISRSRIVSVLNGIS
mmetsp:Transcript_2709/g.4391  ORF Transcript_2709/g.4391 Transcript_2709/m.4391 type:complete len:236 (+) Transcript_2709:372-1079(+)